MKMNKMLRTFVCFVLMLLFARSALAHRIVSCEPEWAALAKELGGEMVTVYSATTGLQDPHRIEARPSLIAMVRNADLLICTGLGVEGGWLPILLANSGNPRIQPGQPGYLDAGNYVQKLDVPTSLDRAQGDVHALGNHHIQNNPYNILLIADVLETLRRDPTNLIVTAPYNDPRAANWLAERTTIPVAVLPTTVGGTEQAKDLFSLFDDTIGRMLAAIKH